ncbi:MAG: class I SAM-dependent methyltransferase [Methylococcales bacterium]|nr:class I SAM-dependent methyltransferase [Methylococcales bacterium]
MTDNRSTTKRMSLSQQAHEILEKFLNKKDRVIDATCGNGYDSLFLSRQVSSLGRVYSFDVQQRAIEATFQRLQKENALAPLTLTLAGHEQMLDYIAKEDGGKIKAVMFNLGYLPCSDKQIMTTSKTTLAALNSAQSILAPSAIMTILVYSGHEGGSDECQAVQTWCANLSKEFEVEILQSIRPNATTPQLFVVRYMANNINKTSLK